MAGLKNPCMNCPDRYPACHGKCEKHQAWKAERNAIATAKYREQKENKDLVVVHHNGLRRRSKK